MTQVTSAMHLRFHANMKSSCQPISSSCCTDTLNELFHQWQQITEALSDLLIRHDTCQSRITRRLPRRCCCLTFEVEPRLLDAVDAWRHRSIPHNLLHDAAAFLKIEPTRENCWLFWQEGVKANSHPGNDDETSCAASSDSQHHYLRYIFSSKGYLLRSGK